MVLVVLVVLVSLVGCVERDPRVQAAEDFRSTAFSLIEKDEAQEKKLAALRLGMTDDEVLHTAGPPSSRETSSTEEQREVWTYSGELKSLGTLTFEDGKLVKIDTY